MAAGLLALGLAPAGVHADQLPECRPSPIGGQAGSPPPAGPSSAGSASRPAPGAPGPAPAPAPAASASGPPAAGAPAPGASTAGAGAVGQARFPAKLAVTRSAIDRRRRTLTVLAPISRRAGGEVDVALQAAGRSEEFTSRIDEARGRVSFRRRIPALQARRGTGILTLRYAGNERTRGQEVRLRVAPRAARLTARRPVLERAGDALELFASGTIARRARGVVRVQLDWAGPGGAGEAHEVTGRIRDGRWRVAAPLPPPVAQSILARRGELHSAILFTGSLAARMRGELRAYGVAVPPAG